MVFELFESALALGLLSLAATCGSRGGSGGESYVRRRLQMTPGT
jgi:hypothetical protein